MPDLEIRELTHEFSKGGYIVRTARGREATAKARERFGGGDVRASA